MQQHEAEENYVISQAIILEIFLLWNLASYHINLGDPFSLLQ